MFWEAVARGEIQADCNIINTLGLEDNVYVLDLYLPPAKGFRRPGQ